MSASSEDDVDVDSESTDYEAMTAAAPRARSMMKNEPVKGGLERMSDEEAEERQFEAISEQAVDKLIKTLGMHAVRELGKVMGLQAAKEPAGFIYNLFEENTPETALRDQSEGEPVDKQAMEELARMLGVHELEEPANALGEMVLDEVPEDVNDEFSEEGPSKGMAQGERPMAPRPVEPIKRIVESRRMQGMEEPPAEREVQDEGIPEQGMQAIEEVAKVLDMIALQAPAQLLKELAVEVPSTLLLNEQEEEVMAKVLGEKDVEELSAALDLPLLKEAGKILSELAMEDSPRESFEEQTSTEAFSKHAVEELAAFLGLHALEEPAKLLEDLAMDQPPEFVLGELAAGETIVPQALEELAKISGMPVLEEAASALVELAFEEPPENMAGKSSMEETEIVEGKEAMEYLSNIEGESFQIPGKQSKEDLPDRSGVVEPAQIVEELAVEEPRGEPVREDGRHGGGQGLGDLGEGKEMDAQSRTSWEVLQEPADQYSAQAPQGGNEDEGRGQDSAKHVGRGRKLFTFGKIRENISKFVDLCLTRV
jgi:hypothetical protein